MSDLTELDAALRDAIESMEHAGDVAFHASAEAIERSEQWSRLANLSGLLYAAAELVRQSVPRELVEAIEAEEECEP